MLCGGGGGPGGGPEEEEWGRWACGLPSGAAGPTPGGGGPASCGGQAGTGADCCWREEEMSAAPAGCYGLSGLEASLDQAGLFQFSPQPASAAPGLHHLHQTLPPQHHQTSLSVQPLSPFYRCEGGGGNLNGTGTGPPEVADVLLSLKQAVVHPPSPPYGPTSHTVLSTLTSEGCGGYGATSLEPVGYFPPSYHDQQLQPCSQMWSPGDSPTYQNGYQGVLVDYPGTESCGGGGGGESCPLPGSGGVGGKRSPSPRPNLCRICGKTYARPSTLKTHLRTHSGEKPYRCDDCNKSFSQAANLTAHVRTHSGEKPFRCPICARRFSQSSSVTTHMRTHSGERPYRCKLCKKAFSDSSTLTKHLRIHSGEKPYQCKLCLLRFSQSGNLNRHMRVHSGVPC